jgi:hypothetical protein
MTVEIHDRNNIPKLLNAFPKEKEQILRTVGMFLEGKVKEKIEKGDPNWPPLSSATLEIRRHKGRYSDKPLYDTGAHILNRITHTVEGDVVKVGIFGESALVACVQEFGATIKVTSKMRAFLRRFGIYLRKDKEVIKIPPRSFLRSTFDENEKEIEQLIGKEVKAVVEKFVIKL